MDRAWRCPAIGRPNSALPAALAVLAALLVLAAPARADPPATGFFGVGGWSYPTAGQAADLGAHGLTMFRASLSWDSVEHTQGTYDWANTDDLLTKAAQNGYSVLFVLNGCAAWACDRQTQTPPLGNALPAYEAFVAAAIQRYGPSGTFWTSNPGLTPRPVHAWQVWNEVNAGADWPNPTPAAYAPFLAQISGVIKGTDPTATVLMSGLDEYPAVSSGMTMVDFLDGLYDQPGFSASFDVAAVHAYASDPAAAVHVLDEARRVMVEHDDASRPLWVTEMGWGTGGPPFAFNVDEPTQNTYLNQSWDTMLACRSRWNLQHVLWFSLTDSSPILGLPDYWGFHDGLLRIDGSAKPSYASFLAHLTATAGSCPLPGGTTLDVTDPDTTITSTPGYTANTAAQPITFVSNEPAAHFQCSPDGSPWVACTSPFNAANSREGDHQIRVRAIDAQGNVDPTPAVGTWQLDLSPPNTTLVSRTPSTTSERTLTVAFTGKDAYGVAGFQCQVDGAAWAPCSSPFTTPTLGPGAHTVAVRSVDLVGHVDPAPLILTFTIVGGQPGRPTFKIGSTRVKVDAKGRGSMPLSCTSKAGDVCTVAGKLTLRVTRGTGKKAKKRTLTLGTLAGSVAAGKSGKLAVRLTKTGRTTLARKGKQLSVSLTGTVVARAGASSPLTANVRLVPPRKAKRKG